MNAAGDRLELIDGQQRLTTLYLIFGYIQHTHLPSVEPKYSLDYDDAAAKRGLSRDPTAGLSGENIDFFHIHQAGGVHPGSGSIEAGPEPRRDRLLRGHCEAGVRDLVPGAGGAERADALHLA